MQKENEQGWGDELARDFASYQKKGYREDSSGETDRKDVIASFPTRELFEKGTLEELESSVRELKSARELVINYLEAIPPLEAFRYPRSKTLLDINESFSSLPDEAKKAFSAIFKYSEIDPGEILFDLPAVLQAMIEKKERSTSYLKSKSP